MFSSYLAGQSTAGINTAGQAYFGLRGGTGTRLRVVEVGVGIASAPTTAPMFYLARSTAAGTATTLAGQPSDPADTAAIGALAYTYTAQPTFSSTNRLVQGGLATTAGGWLVWSFYDDPIIVPATATDGLVIVNANAAGTTLGTFTAYVKWRE